MINLITVFKQIKIIAIIYLNQNSYLNIEYLYFLKSNNLKYFRLYIQLIITSKQKYPVFDIDCLPLLL